MPEAPPRKTSIRPQDSTNFSNQRNLSTATRNLSKTSTGTVERFEEHKLLHQTPTSHILETETSHTLDDEPSTSDRPWYLQVQDEQFAHLNPIAARQQLPKLPSNPPKILEGLLTHLSIDIGLDYLSVLDLRHVEPPPALGANLIMIFGTARSERHLNVSADRFCRWLRTEHKLTPYADGLLGRNELKLKMRRKMRRTRMLTAYGARESSSQDDGITTGWVCVNAGVVDDCETADQELSDGAIGFGTRTSGVSIVVQIMTDEKRGALDLEGLWQGVLNRSGRKQQWSMESTLSSPSTLSQQLNGNTASIRTSAKFLSQSPDPKSRLQQVRGLHTISPRRSADLQSTTDQASLLNELETELTSPNKDLINATPTGVGPAESLKSPSLEVSIDEELQHLLGYLFKLSDDAALEALGHDEHDTSTTPFLQTFFAALPITLEIHHWKSRLELHAYGLHLAHPGYTQVGHRNLLLEALACRPSLPEEFFVDAFNTILFSAHTPGAGGREPFIDNRTRLRPSPTAPRNKNSSRGLTAFRSSMGIAFEILEYMEGHGYNILRPNTLLSLHHAISGPRFPAKLFEDSNPDYDDMHIASLQNIFRELIGQLYVDEKSIPREITIAMLNTYASDGNWALFWNVWRSMALCNKRKDEELYTTMFNSVANSGMPTRALQALRDQAGNMLQEAPAVRVEANGELALAVWKCLQLARHAEQETHVEEQISPNVEKQAGYTMAKRWDALSKSVQTGLRLLSGERLHQVTQELETAREV